ncbi:MAG TPA: ABC transporter ATP-binding protein [Chloroflexota bacterium]|nr:ABC transporter ATP-binding protein [Chloroflexota bacterium]
MGAGQPDLTIEVAEQLAEDDPDRQPVLAVEDLHAYFATDEGVLRAVDGVSFALYSGETLGIVGESGSGKSVTCRAVIRLLPRTAHSSGSIEYGGRNLLRLPSSEIQSVRGDHIAMIFQDPMSSLNPVMRVGDQIAEALSAHRRLSAGERKMQTLELMRLVGIPAPKQRFRDYPHQFSGGMRQRVLIAIALACRPRILLADEPTTALDVTIQDQILTLLLKLREELGMSMILVSHDLAVIAETCDRVAVMYAGQIVESAPTARLLARPRHPYTVGLLRSLPRLDSGDRYLTPIAGAPPSLVDPPTGCRFYDRCPLREDACRVWKTQLLEVEEGHTTRCRRHAQVELTDA